MSRPRLSLLTLALLPTVHAQEADAVTELEAITVTATNPFAALTNNKLSSQAHLKMLGQRNSFEAPVNVVSYHENIIADQQSRSTTDLLGKNDASVTSLGGEGFVLDGISVRGFRSYTREFSLNGLPGLFAGFQSSTAYVGSVDLVKGASGGLGGMSPESAVGASVNVQSKKAGDKDLNRVGLGWFSRDRFQTDVDLSRRFGASREYGLRLNGQYRNGETARRFQGEKNGTIALNLDYDNGTARGQIDLIRNQRHGDAMRARLDQTQNLKYPVPPPPAGKTNLAQPWTYANTSESIIAATGEVNLNSDMTLSAGLGHNKAKYDHVFEQMRLKSVGGDFWDHSVRSNSQGIDTTSANVGLRGYHQTGAVSHDWAASLDYVDRDRFNAFNDHKDAPAHQQTNNIYNVRRFAPPPAFNFRFTNKNINTNRNTSFGLTDTLGFLDDTVRLSLGGRYQHFKQHSTTAQGERRNVYTAKALNPLVALAWQPQPELVVYANYMRDLEPGDVVNDTEAVNHGELLKPMKTRQYEIGVRKDWGDFATTAAYFDISRPSAYLGSDKRYGVHGQTRHRGLEFNGYGSFLDNRLRPGLGLTLMEAKLEKQQERANNGKQLIGTPQFIAKAGLEWDTPWVPGLTLKANVQHYGKTYQNSSNSYAIKGYSLFDAGLRYKTKLGGKDFTLSASAENLFNKKYWQTSAGNGGIILGMPRTYWLNAQIDL